MLRKKVPDEQRMDITMFFGMCIVYSTLFERREGKERSEFYTTLP